MYCPKCGIELIDKSSFCQKCGFAVSNTNSPINEAVTPPLSTSPEIQKTEDVYHQSNQHVTENILMGTDGKMRWIYEMNMWKNLTLLITIGKVFFVGSMFPAVIVFFSVLGDGDGFFEAFKGFIQVGGIVVGIMAVLLMITYPIVILIMGGKYCVIFEMNEFGVNHIQMEKQFKKNQLISRITVIAGVLGGNVQTTAAGLMAGSKQNLYCKFSKVNKVVIKEKRHVIYVNEGLYHNQVYAEPVDFSYVRDFIVSHAKKAKIVYK